MRCLIALTFLFCLFAPTEAQKTKDVPVKGYTRKDGTYVRPHMRSRPGSGSSESENKAGSKPKEDDDAREMSELDILKLEGKLVQEGAKLESEITKGGSRKWSELSTDEKNRILNDGAKRSYRIGMLFYKNGFTKRAVDELTAVVKQYPDQQEVCNAALEKLDALDTDLAKELRKWKVDREEKAAKADSDERTRQDNESKLLADRQAKVEAEERAKKKAVTDKKQAALEVKAASLLRAARQWIAEGDPELARRRLNELLKSYPDTAAAKDAREVLRSLSK